MDVGELRQVFERIGDSAIRALPRVAAACVVVGLAVALGLLVRAAVRRAAARRQGSTSLALALGRLAMAGVLLVGALVAATIAFPNFTPADLISALGIGGVAIGFAFKDILQNFLAGILILITKPFVVRDQIVFGEFEGEVEEIQTRATYLKTYDGRRIVIPNGELFTNAVTVLTAFPQRRMEYDIGIAFGDDLERARHVILEVLADAEGVDPDPKADVILVRYGNSNVGLRARWWSASRISDVLIAQDKVLTEAKRRLHQAGIELPLPTQEILLHDRTGRDERHSGSAGRPDSSDRDVHVRDERVGHEGPRP